MDLVRLRYVGAERVRVPKLGRVVEPDELVAVPVDVFERYAWPESQWKREDAEQAPPPAPAPKSPAAAGKTSTTTSGKGNSDA
ncbi:hypothetical protein ACIBBG_32000 [Micromonospora chersina]|uniref:hypothetical protein n=1 Tax=Micromonospora chersina TaxID=47854 RepID=UPI0037AB34B8